MPHGCGLARWRCHGEGGDVAPFERRKAGYAGLVDSDARIVIDCREPVDTQRERRIAADKAAVGSGHHDLPRILGHDHRSRVDENQLRDSSDGGISTCRTSAR